MKGLRKVLTPFAPDQSGAVSVLYMMNGLIVVCDAGGCTGNICGFDEPRWHETKSAVFSAGLRDMDAIFGRDDLLVKKLKRAADRIDADFAAIVGTPVPAVIATDYAALSRMAEKATGLPVMTVATNGMRLYDAGAEEAYDALFRKFAEPGLEKKAGRAGVIGLLPLDCGRHEKEETEQQLRKAGFEEIFFFESLDQVRMAGSCERIFVLSPSGLKAARYLESAFGVPCEADAPCTDLADLTPYAGCRKILIVQQQVKANAMRERLEKLCAGAEITVAGYFRMDPDLRRKGDLSWTEEDDFTDYVRKEQPDLIITDPVLRELVPDYAGNWMELPHFAMSGRWETP